MLRHIIRVGRALPVMRLSHPQQQQYQRSLFDTIKYNCNGRIFIAPRYFSGELGSSMPEPLRDILNKKNITEPSLIQEKTIPPAMQDKDVVGIARTGSGKTLAFVIPCIVNILKQRELERQNIDQDQGQDSEGFQKNPKKSKSPYCVILAPTRELAAQTYQVFDMFRSLNVHATVLVGGASRQRQVEDIDRHHFDAYIATPGRLNDLLEAEIVDLSKVKVLILDEADRMLDMGMEPQVRTIANQIPKDRQTLMFSATWPVEVQELADQFMKNFEYIAIDSEELKANPNIKQEIQVCQPAEKLTRLLDTLDKIDLEKESKALVFVNMKRSADFMERQLLKYGHRVVAIHGGKTQLQRDRALNDFKRNRCRLMIATDVAARGLDITDITHVINFDFPQTIEDYIHRIGRTARHDRAGTSISLLTEGDARFAKKLVKVLKETGQEVGQELIDLSNARISDAPIRARSYSYSAAPYRSGSQRSGYQRSGYQRSGSYNSGSNDSGSDSYNNRWRQDSARQPTSARYRSW